MYTTPLDGSLDWNRKHKIHNCLVLPVIQALAYLVDLYSPSVITRSDC